MTDTLSRLTKTEDLSIKPANVLRGKPFHEQAVAFSEAFKIGDTLTPEKFNLWSHEKGYLTVPFNADKQSDIWLAHLQRRHQLRYNINKAATHPRMREVNRQPFTIDNAGNKVWEVRAIADAVQRDDTSKRLARLSIVQRRKLLYLQQSEDFVELPPYLRMAIGDITADIDDVLRTTKVVAEGLEKRIKRLTDRVQKAIAEGEITPKNDGIAGLLSIHEEE